MSAATDKTNLAELRRTMTLWHNRVTALGFDGVSDVIALAEAGGDQMKKAWPIGERIALKLMMIKQIGEGSTTANSLPHVARIADEALECIRQRPAAQAERDTGPRVLREVFALCEDTVDKMTAAHTALTTSQPAQSGGERVEFEAWTKTQPHGKYPLRRDQEGQYLADVTEGAWDAYQAGRAYLPTHPAPAAPEGLDEDQLHTVERAADLLEHYAAYINEVKPDDIERHPYVPEIELTAADLRVLSNRGGDA